LRLQAGLRPPDRERGRRAMFDLELVLCKICHVLIIASELTLAFVTVILREWWFFSTLLLLGMFVLVSTSYLTSRYGSVKESRSGIRTELSLRHPYAKILETTAPDQNALNLSFTTQARHEIWSRFATRTYIAIALSSAFLYLASGLPNAGAPFWFSLVLPVFTLVSACFVYKTWGKQA